MKFLKQKLEEVFSIDTRALAAFRVTIGLLILCDLFVRAQDVVVHYTDIGVMPRNILIEKFDLPWRFSFYNINGIAPFQYLLMVIAGIFALCLVVGYRTRLMAVLSWIMLISIQNRNPTILLGADVLFRMALFWSLFLPLGATFSVDQALSKRVYPRRIFSMASVALLMQVFFVYIVVVFHKTAPEWTTEGTAVYYALMVDQFRTSFGGLVLQLGMPILKFLTRSTMALQFYGAFLLFFPFYNSFFRIVISLAFISLQMGMGLSLHLGIFPWISMIVMLPFFPASFWNYLGKKFKVEIQEANVFGKEVFNWIQHKKIKFLGFLKRNFRSKLWMQIIVLLLFIDVVNINILFVKPGLFTTPWMAPIEQLLRLDQGWDMFSPKPPTDDGWYVLPGKLRDGTEVDVYRRQIGVTFDKPVVVADMYPNNRWQKYMMNIWQPAHQEERLYYAQYLCRSWNNAVRDPQKQLVTFEINFLRSDNLLNYKKAIPESVTLWRHHCF